jgi:hypothetical protein
MTLARLSIRHNALTPAMIAAVTSGVKNGSTAAIQQGHFIEGVSMDRAVRAGSQPLAGNSHNQFCPLFQVLLLLFSSFLIFGSPSICPDHARAFYRADEDVNVARILGMWFWGARLCDRRAPVQSYF